MVLYKMQNLVCHPEVTKGLRHKILRKLRMTIYVVRRRPARPLQKEFAKSKFLAIVFMVCYNDIQSRSGKGIWL